MSEFGEGDCILFSQYENELEVPLQSKGYKRWEGLKFLLRSWICFLFLLSWFALICQLLQVSYDSFYIFRYDGLLLMNTLFCTKLNGLVDGFVDHVFFFFFQRYVILLISISVSVFFFAMNQYLSIWLYLLTS